MSSANVNPLCLSTVNTDAKFLFSVPAMCFLSCVRTIALVKGSAQLFFFFLVLMCVKNLLGKRKREGRGREEYCESEMLLTKGDEEEEEEENTAIKDQERKEGK